MPEIYKASLRQMAVPFKIPKKKQASDSCSINMLSPLSRLQDSSSDKAQWSSVTHNGKIAHKTSSVNGNMFSKHNQRNETVGPIGPALTKSPKLHAERCGERQDLSPETCAPGRVTRICSDSTPKGPKHGKICFKLNEHPIKYSPARVNGAPSLVTGTPGSQTKSQTSSTGTVFSGNIRWRPKRASDTLCHDENHKGACESPSLKIRRATDLGQTEECGSFDEEEEEEMEETQRLPTAEDRLHVSQMDRRSKSTDSVCGASASENVAKKDNNGATSNEESISEPSNQRSKSCSTHFVEEKEAPAKRLWTYEKRAASSVTVRKDTPASPKESESRDPFDPFHRNRLSRRPQVLRTYKRTKPSSTEPIVLSSDDEGSDEVNDVSGSLREPQISEGIRDTQLGNLKSPKANARSERSTSKVEVPSIMELPFSTLHYGTVQAEANGTVVITDEGISIPLKGADGEGEVAISVACAQLQWYGVWDGGLAQDGSLLPSTDEPAPSLLFLSVLDAQARLLQKELSAIHTARMSGQACPFVLLVLDSQLEDRQTADLALLMDMIGLRYNQDTLSNSLSWADGLYRLHCHPQGVHFLALLGQDVKDAAQKTSEESSSGPSCLREPTVRRPLRSHTRQQNSRSPRRLIQYPPPPSKGGITVTTEDLECLNDGEFLNDVIIDFYLKYLLLERADKGVAERSHIFSSFFYKQLTRKDNSDPVETGKTAQYRRHQRVRTWTRHVDIFSKDYLFIPVNYEAHWYLVVICFPGLEHPQYVQWRDASQTSKESKPKAISSSAGECQTGSSQSKNNRLKSHNLPDCTVHSCTRETVCRRPCILVMDSLKLSYHQRIYTLLREYLQVEWEVRKGTPRDFTNQNISSSPCRVPQQDNSSDCGLYLLQYVESFLQNPVVHFDLPLRLEHWFPRNQVRRKREELRELVLQLYRRQGGGAEHNIK